MMRTAFKRNGQRWERGIAAVAAAILLLVQLLGAAHFHPLPTAQKHFADAVVDIDHGLCSVCLFRVYSPTVCAATPSLTAPLLLGRIDLVAAESRLCCSHDSHLFVRGPPASV